MIQLEVTVWYPVNETISGYLFQKMIDWPIPPDVGDEVKVGIDADYHTKGFPTYVVARRHTSRTYIVEADTPAGTQEQALECKGDLERDGFEFCGNVMKMGLTRTTLKEMLRKSGTGEIAKRIRKMGNS